MNAMDALARLSPPTLVVGGYGYRNVGDEAMLAGLLQLIGRAEVTVVSRCPAETAALHQVATVGLDGALTALMRHRTVLIGGGALFGRDMGVVGRLLPAYGMLAAIRRKITLVGIGLDDDRSPGRLVLRLASIADPLAVRDQASARLLAAHGLTAEVIGDLSAHMPAAPPSVGERLLLEAGVDLSRPIVGVSLTAVRHNLEHSTLPAIVDAIERLPGLEFCFIPMSQHPFAARHNDLLLAQRVQAAAPRARIVEGVRHPSAVLSAIGRMSLMVGMRYHSLLFARRTGIPIVPISYARKVDNWLSEIGAASVRPTGAAIVAAVTAALTREATPAPVPG